MRHARRELGTRRRFAVCSALFSARASGLLFAAALLFSPVAIAGEKGADAVESLVQNALSSHPDVGRIDARIESLGYGVEHAWAWPRNHAMGGVQLQLSQKIPFPTKFAAREAHADATESGRPDDLVEKTSLVAEGHAVEEKQREFAQPGEHGGHNQRPDDSARTRLMSSRSSLPSPIAGLLVSPSTIPAATPPLDGRECGDTKHAGGPEPAVERGIKPVVHHILVLFRRSALAMTDTELKLIAAAASIGLSSRPKKG